MEPADVRLARIEEGIVAVRRELRDYHKAVQPLADRVDSHHTSIAVLKRDRWWISSLAGVVFSWLGLKLFGKG